jgi:hypothetical protein
MENDPLLFSNEDRVTKKQLLESKIEAISESLTSQLEDKKELGKKILIITAVITAGYALVKLLTSNNDEDESPKHETPSMLGGIVKGAVTSLLLTVLKNKLTTFLQDTAQQND